MCKSKKITISIKHFAEKLLTQKELSVNLTQINGFHKGFFSKKQNSESH